LSSIIEGEKERVGGGQEEDNNDNNNDDNEVRNWPVGYVNA
jgi:hypothetical protein